ncbi:DUF3103 family protein [Micromonospora sp. NPDC051925]|uniref:DUF3103 family protein n=1 Tax=Micromonospora sp. NPDC051925 TaxID=3364288 RepID=UPI0037C91AFF
MRQRRGSLLIAVAVGTLAATALHTAAAAAPVPVRVPVAQAQPTVSPVQTVKDELNQQLVRALQDPVARRTFVGAIVDEGQADLTTVLAEAGAAGADFTRAAIDANQQVINLKGLDGMRESALRGRLANPATARQLASGVAPLLAASPRDNTTDKTFPAYDLNGRRVDLELATMASVPVILVELDEDTINPIGLRIISAELNALGMASDLQAPAGDEGSEPMTEGTRTAGAASRAAAGGGAGTAGEPQYTATRLDRIGLTDDEEPPWKFGAEIYGLVLGQGKDGKGRTDVVDMQYLDNDHTWYYPHQQLINWSNFKWNSVDLLLMEQDDSTNYKAIAKTVVSSVGALVGWVSYVPLINAVLDALPNGWFTDDDDYVDSFYMLNKTQNTYLWGAAHNAQIKISPVTVTAS